MKTFTKVVMVAGLTFGAMAAAHADTQLVAADNEVTSKICVVAAKGSKMKLHAALKDVGLSRDYVEKNITCNGMPIVEFVEQYGENVAKINRYITAGEYTGTLISRAN
ncbi:DUF3718 domain-containing protein [Alteromonas lipolytica]|uniref:DUF3718 domain-containing protein n=1 Tax=Alteromonas lipolytica TaxID=1856405 RepID=A0A1E8FHW1_9ALTE|nr:DUF3718 domain-containing protein [Alteromonas lipolytica]OFI35537.1 hypothetical protein BFC17_12300 [Alteromonas lipolytica]GGF77029.1 hypothetical protein GCM10011338_31620 [Alteromonas lipolytica]